MKIGYYIPNLWHLPANYKGSVHYSKVDSRESPIKWDSLEGIALLESFFKKGNMSLPSYNPKSDYKYQTSFKNQEDLVFYLRIIFAVHKLSEFPYWLDVSPFIQSALIKDVDIQTKFKNTLKALEDLKKYSNDELVGRLERIANELYVGYDLSNHSFSHQVLSLWDTDNIEIRGFKFSEEVYDPAELYFKLGYNYDFLKHDMKELKKFNSLHRNNTNKSLNTFYKVIRTNNLNDLLYISKERTRNQRDNIILVLKDHKIESDLGMPFNSRGSDQVYFYKFATDKDGFVALIVKDIPYYSRDHGEKGKYGRLIIQDPKTNKLMRLDHPIIQDLKNRLYINYIIEGYKVTNMINGKEMINNEYAHDFNLFDVIPGSMGVPCLICECIPCDCQTILHWEKFRDGSDSANTGRPYFGFSRDRALEEGASPNCIETEYDRGNPTIDNIPGREYDQMRYFNENIKDEDSGGLNWGSYNDQLDMDQQSQDFWEGG